MADAPTAPRAQPWTALLAILLGIAAFIFCSIVIVIVGTAFGASASHPTPAMNLASNFSLDLSFVGAALYFSILRGGGRSDFGYRRIPLGLGLAAAVLGFGGYFGVTTLYALALNLHGSDKLPSGFGVNRSDWALAGTAVFVCVAAPMAEEFFFRGFLFGSLRRMRIVAGGRDLGPWVAAVIVGLLFGLAHTGSASSKYLIPLGFLGFLLCIVRWRTGSLYPCMAIHSFNNCLALGVDQLSWPAWAIALLTVGSLAVIGLITLPLAGNRRGGGRLGRSRAGDPGPRG
jgi:membrane protease YdiL (CAAX protease family)